MKFKIFDSTRDKFLILFHSYFLCKKISKEKEKELFENIKSKYDSQIKPYYAASRLWLDAVIDPVDTRKWITLGIEAANNNSVIEDYKTGVIKT